MLSTVESIIHPQTATVGFNNKETEAFGVSSITSLCVVLERLKTESEELSILI